MTEDVRGARECLEVYWLRWSILNCPKYTLFFQDGLEQEYQLMLKVQQTKLAFSFMHLANTLMQIDLNCIESVHFISSSYPWESNPWPLALF